MDVIEQLNAWCERYTAWKSKSRAGSLESLDGYPFVENARAPFTPLRRSLSMLNLALITSPGAYIDGTDPFDTGAPGGDTTGPASAGKLGSKSSNRLVRSAARTRAHNSLGSNGFVI